MAEHEGREAYISMDPVRRGRNEGIWRGSRRTIRRRHA